MNNTDTHRTPELDERMTFHGYIFRDGKYWLPLGNDSKTPLSAIHWLKSIKIIPTIKWYDDMEEEPAQRYIKTQIYQCSKEMYYEQLGTVPPIYAEGIDFAVGEAYSYNDRQETTYACFKQHIGKFYVTIDSLRGAAWSFMEELP